MKSLLSQQKKELLDSLWKKYIIISHSHCTDGLCSASLMKKALQLAYGSDTKINVVFASYGKEEDALSKQLSLKWKVKKWKQ